MPKLSILIPSLVERKRLLQRLLAVLDPQCIDQDVEIITDVDNREVTIGCKRQRMIERATGDYIVFIDDDDMISDVYVRRILKALESSPDCVTYKLHYSPEFNSLNSVPVEFGLRFERDANLPNKFERLPNHLCPVKRDLSLKAGFKNIKFGEDADYARRLRPSLKTEVHIDKVLYYYLDYKK